MFFTIWSEETEQTHGSIVIQINSDVIPLRNIFEGIWFRIKSQKATR